MKHILDISTGPGDSGLWDCGFNFRIKFVYPSAVFSICANCSWTSGIQIGLWYTQHRLKFLSEPNVSSKMKMRALVYAHIASINVSRDNTVCEWLQTGRQGYNPSRERNFNLCFAPRQRVWVSAALCSRTERPECDLDYPPPYDYADKLPPHPLYIFTHIPSYHNVRQCINIVTCMLQAMWHVLTTVGRQTTRDMFSMWSDPSLHATVEGTIVLFMVCSRDNNELMRQEVLSLWSVPRLYNQDD
jgi:hypothetical protein